MLGRRGTNIAAAARIARCMRATDH